MDVELCWRSFYLFEHLHLLDLRKSDSEILRRFLGWSQISMEMGKKICFNAFNGGSKLAKKDRLPRIWKIQENLKTVWLQKN